MEYPQYLLKDIYWSFRERKYSFEEKFISDLKAYHKSISGDELTLSMNDVILQAKVVILQSLVYDQEDEPTEPQDRIEADKPDLGFRCGELLYKMHNKIHDRLKDADNCYFEGLLFATDEDPDHQDAENEQGYPVYFVLTGS